MIAGLPGGPDYCTVVLGHCTADWLPLLSNLGRIRFAQGQCQLEAALKSLHQHLGFGKVDAVLEDRGRSVPTKISILGLKLNVERSRRVYLRVNR